MGNYIQAVDVDVIFLVVDENNKVRGQFVHQDNAKNWALELGDSDNKIYTVKEMQN